VEGKAGVGTAVAKGLISGFSGLAVEFIVRGFSFDGLPGRAREQIVVEKFANSVFSQAFGSYLKDSDLLDDQYGLKTITAVYTTAFLSSLVPKVVGGRTTFRRAIIDSLVSAQISTANSQLVASKLSLVAEPLRSGILAFIGIGHSTLLRAAEELVVDEV
jgi:hypothetical protein